MEAPAAEAEPIYLVSEMQRSLAGGAARAAKENLSEVAPRPAADIAREMVPDPVPFNSEWQVRLGACGLGTSILKGNMVDYAADVRREIERLIERDRAASAARIAELEAAVEEARTALRLALTPQATARKEHC